MYQSGSLKQLRIEILVHILFGQTGDESAGQMFHHVVCLLLRFLGCVSVRKKKKINKNSARCSFKWALWCNVRQVTDFISRQSSPQDRWSVLQLLPATVNMPTSQRHWKKQPETGVSVCVCVCVCEHAYFACVCVTGRARNSLGSASHSCLVWWLMRGLGCGACWTAERTQTAQPASQLPAISHMWVQPRGQTHIHRQ